MRDGKAKQNDDSQYPYKRDNRLFRNLGLIAFFSAIWILLRTGQKPTRLAYPCQQTALSNIQMYVAAIAASILARIRRNV